MLFVLLLETPALQVALLMGGSKMGVSYLDNMNVITEDGRICTDHDLPAEMPRNSKLIVKGSRFN